MKTTHILLAAAVLTIAGFVTLFNLRDRINLILISIDTLRPDHLGCYGYDRDTSPNLDTLASEGLLFEDVTSQSPWTLPSQASLFTSAYPSTHGLTREGRSLDPDFTTLAELLRGEGYRTAAFTGGGYMHRRFGLAQGFEVYRDRYVIDGKDYAPFLDVHWSTFREMVLEWLRDHCDEPFFLFIHCYDVHKPYDPPAEYVRPFYPACQGEIISFVGHDEVVFKEKERSVTRVPVDSLSDDQLDHVVSHYDGEVRRVDEEVGILLEVLDQLGLRNETLVIVTSDHGEQFLEHGGLGHRNTLYQEELAVPLIMRLPAAFRPGRRVKESVSLVDISPTVASLLSIDAESLAGNSLVPILIGEGLEQPVLSEFLEGGLVALREGRYKLIVSKDGSPQLFDLEEDPDEHVDVSGTLPEIKDRLFENMKERVALNEKAGESYQTVETDGTEDDYIDEQLKALGYLEE